MAEFSTFAYNYHPLYHWRMYRNWREFVFAMHGATSFLGLLSPTALLCCYFAFKIRYFSLKNGFCSYGRCVHCPLDISPDLSPVQDWESHLVVKNPQTLPSMDLSGVGLILSCSTVTLTGAQALPADGTDCRDTFLVPKPKMYGILTQWTQYNKFVENGSKN